MDNSKPKNGNLLVMVEALPAECVEEETSKNFRIGKDIKQRMEDSATVDQGIVKVRDQLCDRGSENEAGFQKKDCKEENPAVSQPGFLCPAGTGAGMKKAWQKRRGKEQTPEQAERKPFPSLTGENPR